MTPQNYKAMYVAVDVIGIVICFFMYFNFTFGKLRKKSFDRMLFDSVVLATNLLLISDCISWLLNGIKEYYISSFIITAFYYTMHAVIISLWILYCDFQINESYLQIRKRMVVLIPLCMLSLVVAFTSNYTSILFNISSNNIYTRGDFYIIFMIINFVFLLYSVYIVAQKIIKDRKNNTRNKRLIILLIYPFLPIIGTLIQASFYGVNIIWITTSVALLLVYFNFQSTQLITDPLTGINNRYSFDRVLDKELKGRLNNKDKFIALIDLNKFKAINDNYGHFEGDEVLKIVANKLLKCVNTNDFIARIGGDEFVILGERENKREIEQLIDDIKNAINNYNEISNKDYKISLSIGYSKQNEILSKDKEDMLKEADSKMYLDKKEQAENN